LLPGAIFELKIHQNACAAGVSPRTPLGKLTELPDPLAGFREPFRGRGGGRGGMGREREGMRKREGVAFPHFFIYNLTTVQH